VPEVAAAIFLITMAVIISEKLNRTTVAMAGGMAMVVTGVLDQEQALASIDANTIGLLVGMMIIVDILRRTGFFDHVAWRATQALGGSPWRLMAGFMVFTAVASALLDNVTTLLLLAPITLSVCRSLGLDARPFIISQVIASNIGGTATLIGDPPNIMIGGATGLSFMDFLVNLGPAVLVILPLTIAWFWWLYGRKPAQSAPRLAGAPLPGATLAPVHTGSGNLLRVSLIVLAGTIAGFFLHGVVHVAAGTVALMGAVVLLLLSRIDPHDVLINVEWSTIFFFTGLFIVVGGLEHSGLIEAVAERVVAVVGGNFALATFGLLWFAGIASAIVDNIPAVATLIPLTFAVARLLYPDLAHLDAATFAAQPEVAPLWWALALGACLGGNGTLIGASANVVGVSIAERHGRHIGFWGFTRVGLPVAVGSLVVATVYVWVRYLL
jgi:Na+/H+ antiporter NhaD/arsenite permease-like protein